MIPRSLKFMHKTQWRGSSPPTAGLPICCTRADTQCIAAQWPNCSAAVWLYLDTTANWRTRQRLPNITPSLPTIKPVTLDCISKLYSQSHLRLHLLQSILSWLQRHAKGQKHRSETSQTICQLHHRTMSQMNTSDTWYKITSLQRLCVVLKTKKA